MFKGAGVGKSEPRRLRLGLKAVCVLSAWKGRELCAGGVLLEPLRRVEVVVASPLFREVEALKLAKVSA